MANYKEIFSAFFQKTPKLPKKSLNQKDLEYMNNNVIMITPIKLPINTIFKSFIIFTKFFSLLSKYSRV